jgi:hypothetical protein
MRLRIVLLLTLAAMTGGCDDELDRLRQENALQRQHVSTLTTENAALLETQSKSLGELQAERERTAQVLAEDRALRNYRELAAAVITLLACALAASLYGQARRRKERDVSAV